MPTILVNPLDEGKARRERPAPRLASLQGETIALLDIGKRGSSPFLDRLESLLRDDFGVGAIIRETKPTFARPAPEEVIDRLREAGAAAVVEALAD